MGLDTGYRLPNMFASNFEGIDQMVRRNIDILLF